MEVSAERHSDRDQTMTDEPKLVEGRDGDFYWEGPYMVFTEKYLRERGYCCKSGCRHCPYGFNDRPETKP